MSDQLFKFESPEITDEQVMNKAESPKRFGSMNIDSLNNLRTKLDLPTSDQVEGEIDETDTQAVDLTNRLLYVIDIFNHPLSSALIGRGREKQVRLKISMAIKFLIKRKSLEKVTTFIDRLTENEQFILAVQQNPEMISNLFSIYTHQEILTDPAKLSNFSYNMSLYGKALSDIRREGTLRMQNDPIAKEEELEAGAYRENLELQVRDAVFALRRKGYNSFESGFGDKVTGEQFIGFDKTNAQRLPDIPDELTKELSSKNISIEFKEMNDRYQLILTPIAEFPSIDEWKDVWGIVADLMPSISNLRAIENTHTGLSRTFRDKQEKLRINLS